jgi:hypothetical protein
VTPELRRALLYCHHIGCAISGSPMPGKPNHWCLTVYRQDDTVLRVYDGLVWGAYLEAFRYWGRIEHPGKGRPKAEAAA